MVSNVGEPPDWWRIAAPHLASESPPNPAVTPPLLCHCPERNPGIVHLPNSAAAALARVRVFSCDCGVLFNNAAMFTGAVRLQHLLLRCESLLRPLLAATTCLLVQGPTLAWCVGQLAAAGSRHDACPENRNPSSTLAFSPTHRHGRRPNPFLLQRQRPHVPGTGCTGARRACCAQRDAQAGAGDVCGSDTGGQRQGSSVFWLQPKGV